ncbi:hypothetical protein G7Y89_g5738 [Cudoniella acicularis]|uniref:Pentatricopeptide repeat-containing protein n=1 Tax=Cudoniella acicularis TaxID=354080 RepID=A0A8H4RLY7_9HELO|nr:hypothetical protein G7Y89_g5738 [Cudoniella acicularis]
MQQAFGLLTPGFRSGHIDNVPITAIATLVLLTKDTICGEVVSGAAPFIHALRNVVAVCDSDISKIAATRSLGTGPVPDYVTREWPSIKELVAETPTTLPEKSSSSLEASHKYVRLSIFKRLQDALGKRDASQVDRLWADAEQLQVSHDENDENGNPSASGQSKRYNGLTPVLCNQFILVYMALRKPNRAVDVWNHMVAKSLNPTAATWNAMLGGCKASKDVNALETVWDKMQASSIKPDTGCWTTRISGLVDCGHIDAALSALEDMGKRWLREKTEGYKSARAGAAEPTIATINAVVAGLLRKQKPDAAYRVLAWADKLGISPDVITFNTLLRPLIREGRSKQASTLLQQMQKSGVEADVATFTTIIDETLSSADKKTPEQQIKVISGVLSKMEKSGVQANMHTYGKLIYQLLRTSPGDLTAVNAILERMFEKGLQPSTHIYTMLLEHYFSQSPPDLGAVRGLIERTRLQHGSTDHVFWDRVIEGYARAGETALAMQVLGRLNNKKNMAGWITLRTLLGALVENEEWDAARTLVSNTVADRGGPISQVERGREGQHLFWELAEQLGII